MSSGDFASALPKRRTISGRFRGHLARKLPLLTHRSIGALLPEGPLPEGIRASSPGWSLGVPLVQEGCGVPAQVILVPGMVVAEGPEGDAPTSDVRELVLVDVGHWVKARVHRTCRHKSWSRLRG